MMMIVGERDGSIDCFLLTSIVFDDDASRSCGEGFAD